ncbi:acetyl-CoA synthetase-like protein [Dendrothele bispora CBS 962.96]|uniref:Acetyl-CoA synthetase-like protein n=1 Tax=Dendrothele bispora (strain CBS 962.96) TaxID=1314807 RepID=A0A4S8MXP3_DENBC|nr:acetyl-CoA synthetase-like protein [Dendrothele bispora CBS 962.96]
MARQVLLILRLKGRVSSYRNCAEAWMITTIYQDWIIQWDHGSLTFMQMLDWHYTYNPSYPLFLYAPINTDADPSPKNVAVTWGEAVEAVYTGAKLLKDRVPDSDSTNTSADSANKAKVIAILSHSDAIPYYTTVLSILRANCVPFPISPRNSPQAVAHLINQVGVSHVLLGHDQSMQQLMERAAEFLKEDFGYTKEKVPSTSMVPVFEDLYLSETQNDRKERVGKIKEEIPLKTLGPKEIQMYLHSSGSTAFPKPIPWTSHGVQGLTTCVQFAGRSLTGKILSLHVTPVFHAMGYFHIFSVAATGVIYGVFPPQTPPVVPSPQNVFEGASRTGAKYAWSHSPAYVKWLAGLSVVFYGGGPLDREVGNRLSEQGVPICCVYGSTELGVISEYPPAEVLRDAWNYFKLSKGYKFHLIPSTKDGDGGDIKTFEPVVLSGGHCMPQVFNSTIDGVDAYSTHDMIEEHPKYKGYWRILGRVDSQIIHSSGEKTNPGPLESIMNQDPHISACVMFGHGKFQAGIIVEPVKEEQEQFIESLGNANEREAKLEEFRNKIWPTVEKMNAYAPQHSRMILVASPSKPFTYTAKNTTRNAVIIREYAPEIEALYANIEESTQPSIPAPQQWNLESSKAFVIVAKVATLLIQQNSTESDKIMPNLTLRLTSVHQLYKSTSHVFFTRRPQLWSTWSTVWWISHGQVSINAVYVARIPAASYWVPDAGYSSSSSLSLVRSHQLMNRLGRDQAWSDSVKPDQTVMSDNPVAIFATYELWSKIGGDSLQATWIRNSIMRALRDGAKIDTRGAASNFVYEYPTIETLGAFVAFVVGNRSFDAAVGQLLGSDAQLEAVVQGMNKMVEKYSKDLVVNSTSRFNSATGKTRKVVLMTGSTGSVGVHILDRLLEDSAVEKVYALIRRGKDNKNDIKTKQKEAFVERGVDPGLVESSKLVLLEAQLIEERFGLGENVFEGIKEELTHIIANAWRVDFNLGLTSFESDIKGLRYMVDLALTTGSLLVFTSSVGIFRGYNYAEKRPFSEVPVSPKVASARGYTQSKWVSEQIIQNASSTAGLHSVIVRLGQACGSPNGSWNRKEWLPALVRSAPFLGCIPDDDREISWIPADLVARAFRDFLDTPNASAETQRNPSFVHLIHPRPVRWSTLARTIGSKLNVDVVPFTTWLKKLEEVGKKDKNAEDKISALRILPSYQGMAAKYNGGSHEQAELEEAFGMTLIRNENAKRLSKTLADPDVPQLGQEDLMRWLAYWGL